MMSVIHSLPVFEYNLKRSGDTAVYKEQPPASKKTEVTVICRECLMAMIGGQHFHHCNQCPCCKNVDRVGLEKISTQQTKSPPTGS